MDAVDKALIIIFILGCGSAFICMFFGLPPKPKFVLPTLGSALVAIIIFTIKHILE